MTTNRRRPKFQPDPCLAVGYVRVSTEEQVESGLGLAAQRAAITTEAERRGCALVTILEDAGVSGTLEPKKRPGLARALEMLEGGEAGVLIVAKGDRVSRSLGDLCALMDRSARNGWGFVAVDLNVDTTTAMGRAMAQISGVFAELERNLISERTRAALQVKKAAGVRLGRASTLPEEVRARIKQRRGEGATLRAIAAELDADTIPTGQGGSSWRASSVQAVLDAGGPAPARETAR